MRHVKYCVSIGFQSLLPVSVGYVAQSDVIGPRMQGCNWVAAAADLMQPRQNVSPRTQWSRVLWSHVPRMDLWSRLLCSLCAIRRALSQPLKRRPQHDGALVLIILKRGGIPTSGDPARSSGKSIQSSWTRSSLFSAGRLPVACCGPSALCLPDG